MLRSGGGSCRRSGTRGAGRPLAAAATKEAAETHSDDNRLSECVAVSLRIRVNARTRWLCEWWGLSPPEQDTRVQRACLASSKSLLQSEELLREPQNAAGFKSAKLNPPREAEPQSDKRKKSRLPQSGCGFLYRLSFLLQLLLDNMYIIPSDIYANQSF